MTKAAYKSLIMVSEGESIRLWSSWQGAQQSGRRGAGVVAESLYLICRLEGGRDGRRAGERLIGPGMVF